MMNSDMQNLHQVTLKQTDPDAFRKLARVEVDQLPLPDILWFVLALADASRKWWITADSSMVLSLTSRLDVAVERLVAVDWSAQNRADFELFQRVTTSMAMAADKVPEAGRVVVAMTEHVVDVLADVRRDDAPYLMITFGAVVTSAAGFGLPEVVERFVPDLMPLATTHPDIGVRLEAIEALVQVRPTVGTPLLAEELVGLLVSGHDDDILDALKIALTFPNPEFGAAVKKWGQADSESLSPEVREKLHELLTAHAELWEWSEGLS